MKKTLVLSIFCLMASSVAQAYNFPVRVAERVYFPSCSYYSTVNADYRVMLQVPQAPAGTTAEIHLGWNGKVGQRMFSWKNRSHQAATRRLKDVFVFDVSQAIRSRGSQTELSGMSFRFKIVDPNGRVTWYGGNRFPLSYFQVSTKFAQGSVPCKGSQRIPYKRANMKVVERNDY